jgi:ATP-binding cassette subfamily F protein 3
VWRKQGGAELLQQSARKLEVPRPAQQPANGNRGKTEVTTSAEQKEEQKEDQKSEKAKRLNPIKRKQMEDRFREIEEDISRVETAISDCETALLTFVSAEEMQRLTQKLNSRREELQSLMSEWEELGQALQA